MSRRSLSQMSQAVARHMRARRESHSRAQAPVANRPSGDQPVRLLDWVELSQPQDSWPTGTLGSIVDLRGRRALVEIADERGHAVDLLPVDVAALRPTRA